METLEHAGELAATAKELVAEGKGILAADESTPTLGKRFAKLDIESTADSRRDYRELYFTAEGASDAISGVILYDETIRQNSSDGTAFPKLLESQGIIPGIKVDTGAKPLAGAPGETITEGLDGLRERLNEYRAMGARFAKWRAVITIGAGTPSRYAIETNAHALARYAALCQEAGIVPIVEPEVLMDGDHSIERCYEVTEETLHTVFDQLYHQRVMNEGILLKPNMVISGTGNATQADVKTVAEMTLKCLRTTVPATVPGIAFLSGGQSDELATDHLNEMNRIGDAPWELSFSYGRALQAPALNLWKGQAQNLKAAQQAYLLRARCNSAARSGKYSPDMEKSSA
ncbi:MAG: class I fructose-bisphosphate aldolase [Actinomycetota bacterium]